MRGAGGNDDFYIMGGKDTVNSGANDADRFFFDATSPADAKITGFNGAGKYGGDRLYFDNGYGSSITSTIMKSAARPSSRSSPAATTAMA